MFKAYGLEDIPRQGQWYKSKFSMLGAIRFIRLEKFVYRIETAKGSVKRFSGPFFAISRTDRWKWEREYGLPVTRSTIIHYAEILEESGRLPRLIPITEEEARSYGSS